VAPSPDALEFEIYDHGDAQAEIDRFFDRLIGLLHRRFDGVSRFEFELLLADLRHEARIALAPYSKIDPEIDASVIVDALVEHAEENQKESKA
jgi:hypothetical protein